MSNNKVIVKVENLRKLFPAERKLFGAVKHFVHAVDDISFEIEEGKSMGLVGESGCGKTTTGKILVGLYEPTDGRIIIEGKDVTYYFMHHKQAKEYLKEKYLKKFQEGEKLSSEELDDATKEMYQLFQKVKGNERVFYDSLLSEMEHKRMELRKRFQIIFQDPYESLNPRMTIFDIIAEPLNIHNIGNIKEREEKVSNLLKEVGLTPPENFLFRFPHELSGGQRQRVAIARALVLNPKFVVADEPTSMLDVSVRTGIMQLMMELMSEHNMSYLYITHDLAVARYMTDRIAVMYLGKIVETGPTEEVLHNPQHPYTKALLSAVPVPDPTVKREEPNIKGSVAKPIDPPPRCRFYDRCPLATEKCKTNPHPPLKEVAPDHYVACYVVAGD